MSFEIPTRNAIQRALAALCTGELLPISVALSDFYGNATALVCGLACVVAEPVVSYVRKTG